MATVASDNQATRSIPGVGSAVPGGSVGTYKARRFAAPRTSKTGTARLAVPKSVPLEQLEKMLDADKTAVDAMKRDVLQCQEDDLAETHKQVTLLRQTHDKLKVQEQGLEHKHQEITRELEIVKRGITTDNRSKASALEQQRQQLQERIQENESVVHEVLLQKERLGFMTKRLANGVLEVKKEAKRLQVALSATEHELASCEGHFQQSKQELQTEEDRLSKLQEKVAQRRELQERSLTGLQRIHEERSLQLDRQSARVKERDDIMARSNGEMRSDEEEKLARTCVVRNVFCSVLQKKVEDERQALTSLEDKFQEIKNATGLSEVDDIINRYQSRAAKNQQLHLMAEEIRQRSELSRKENAENLQILDELTAVNKNQSGNRDIYQEVDLIDQALASSRKQGDDAAERANRLSVTVDRLRDTLARFMSKVDNKTHSTVSNEKLPEMFSQLDSKISQMMKAVNAALLKDDRGDKASDGRAKDGSSGGPKFSLESINVNRVLYHNMMAVEPDTSTRNMRIKAHQSEEGEKYKRKILLGQEYISDGEEEDDSSDVGALHDHNQPVQQDDAGPDADPFVDRA
ncbi:unnamed protein product, partial [Chrysoparadoxa australica]